jgi:hypothetical protein
MDGVVVLLAIAGILWGAGAAAVALLCTRRRARQPRPAQAAIASATSPARDSGLSVGA